MHTLSANTALVTGATSGIGKSITQALIQNGCKVHGIARDFSKVDFNPEDFIAHKLDLGDLNQTSTLIKNLCKQHNIDYFIHCAGAGLFGSIEQFSVKQIDAYIKTNLTSALTLSHHIVPHMKKNKSGRIIFMGSESALKAGKKGALYSSAKFAIRGLAQSLREDCSRHNINVSLINPGMVRTPFFDQQDFTPATDNSNAIEAADIAATVLHILQSRSDIVFDEINISPRNKSIDFK